MDDRPVEIRSDVESLKSAPPPALESFPKVGYCGVPGCGLPSYQTPYGNVCKNGHGGATLLDSPPESKQTVKPLVIPPTTSSPVMGKAAADFSKINPEKDWECFGCIEENHSECKECPFAQKCRDKKASKK